MSAITIADAGSYVAITVDGNTSSYPYNSIFIRNIDNELFSLYSDDGDILYADISDVVSPASADVNTLITNTAFIFQTPAPAPVPEIEDVRSVLENIRNFQESYIRAELKKGRYAMKSYDDHIASGLNNDDAVQFNFFGVGPISTTLQIAGPDYGLVAMHPFFDTPPTVGQVLEVVSDSADDDGVIGGAIGAYAVFIEGLDENFEFTTDFVILNGLTSVFTTKLFTRVNRALVVASGTNNTNVGNIRIIHNETPQYIGAIPAGVGFNNFGVFTAPLDYSGYVFKQVLMSCDVACEVIWYQRDVANTVNNRFRTIKIHLQPGTTNVPLLPPPGLPGKFDNMITARALSGTGNISVMGNGYFIKQQVEIDGPDTSGTAPQPYPTIPHVWSVQN